MSSDVQRPKDCASCRIIGGMGLTCAGIFVAYHGRTFKGYGRAGMYTVASIAIGLGLVRLASLEGYLSGSFRST